MGVPRTAMLPGPSYGGGTSLLPEYVRRLMHSSQMDLEYSLWQMLYLCVNPTRVYTNTKWHKQTKHQWARDDPGFAGLIVWFLMVSSFAFAIAFASESFARMMRLMFWAIVIDFLLVGLGTATVGWWLCNRYLRVDDSLHNSDQRVEWMYAFDIHCNAFFPLYLVLYVAQYFLMPLLLSTSFLATLASNALYAFAFCYYCYVTFLGYSVLPFL